MRKREKHITRLHIILFFLVLIIGVSIFIGIRSKHKEVNNNYKKYEERMVETAPIYIKLNDIDIEDGEQLIIELEDIKPYLYEIPDECDGYVVALSEENNETEEFEINYTAYLKCGKYKTKNYSEDREE